MIARRDALGRIAKGRDDPLPRFMAYVSPEPNSGCWLWDGSYSTTGYGQFSIGLRPKKAHRVSWLLHRGPIPKGSFVLHRCDNPACVNPEHLEIGSHRKNMDDMRQRGHARGGRPGIGNPKITEQQAAEIRRRYENGETYAGLAAAYGLRSKNSIANIVRGITWTRKGTGR